MKFLPQRMPGIQLIQADIFTDERGSLQRAFCHDSYERIKLNPMIDQANLSRNKLAGTLRGFHYQEPPFGEDKTLICITGRVYDVIIDLRPDSPTYLQWQSFELSGDKPEYLFWPAGYANAFLTLEDNTTLLYLASKAFAPDSYRGIRWDDPLFGVSWPHSPRIISPRDASFPNWTPPHNLPEGEL